MNKKFKGVFTALVTPFDKNGKINDKALESIVKANIASGVSGFYVCGSTGEAFLMSTDERKYVMDVVKSCAGDKTLIAHIGSINENEAYELGEYANKLSYDMVSSVTPYYYKFSFSEIRNYYIRVADRACLPMLAYHIPALSGVTLGVKDLSSFLADDRFCGIKYTSNDYFTFEQIKTAFPDKIVYNGYDEMYLSGLAMGADGAIGTTYNFMAGKFVNITKLFAEGKNNEAREVQQQANRIITVLCKIGVIPATKEVLNQLGFEAGVCRKPFGDLATEDKALIKKEIIPYL
jgi:N-acetylneuraminate lyase